MKRIILRGGRVIDPANGVNALLDVAIAGERIEAIGVNLPTAGAEIIDCSSQLVLPGLIDTHAHVYEHVTGRFGLNADLCGVRSGVTTLVDQGGPSCMTLPGFRHFVVEPAKSRVLAYLSAYLVGGLEGHYYPTLYRPDCVDVQATVKAALANPDLVKGIKAHAEMGGFARWGIEVMKSAAAIGRETGLPVYLHFGQLWPLPTQGGMPVDPDTILTDVLELMKPGDVLAHPFSRHPGGFVNKKGQLHPLVKEAVARGLRIDVGHGSHFSFKTARTVLEAGVVPDTLGADMHGHNTRVPAPGTASGAAADGSAPGAPAHGSAPGAPAHRNVSAETSGEMHLFAGRTQFSLVSAMTSLLALGLELEHVVAMVTSNAARMIGMEREAGSLGAGRLADVSVLSDTRGRWILTDNEGNHVEARRRLEPVFCLRAGERFAASAPILPVLRAA